MDERKTLFSKKITDYSKKFTPSDRKIADFLLRSYPKCLLKNATEIAREVGINVSTVTRFFQKIGYKSIRAAHAEFREDADFIISSPMDRIKRKKSAAEETFSDIVDLDIQNIQNTVGALQGDQLERLITLLGRQTPTVFVAAERSKPFALAYYLYVQLRLIRSGVQMLGADKSVITHALVDAGPRDLMVIFDFRRYCKTNRDIVKAFCRSGGTLVVFTDSPLSPNSADAELCFQIDTKNPSLFDSYTAGFTLINLIIARLAEASPELIGKKYRRLELIYRDLDIFI